MTKKTLLVRMARAARAAARRAYAPYSRFRVGAAVLTDKGRIYSGSNVENASYGLSICAERVAIFKAVSAGARGIKAVLVWTDTEELTPPCGACLQVINEFGLNPAVILANRHGTKQRQLRELLPLGFLLT